MRKIDDLSREHNSSSHRMKGGIFLLLAIIAIAIVQFVINANIEKHGVYSICRVLSIEGRKGGTLTTIEYRFRNTSKHGIIGSSLNVREGGVYFVKLITDDPDHLLIIDNVVVPPCVDFKSVPYDGWKELPSCK